jgi:hypothetical protein
MNLHILKGYDGVRIWPKLPVGSLEPKGLIKRDSFVEVSTR